jgi:hypothetical protein
VPERAASVIILAEDQEQQNLARRYLLRVDARYQRRLRLLPLPGRQQSGSQYVREQFPKQVRECRRRISRGASCLLIVLTDADERTTREREETLEKVLSGYGQARIGSKERIVVLIPKWQIETWIKCLLGKRVSEDDKTTDQPAVTAREISAAAHTLYAWARPNAKVGTTCVPSLTAALPRWRKIG